MTTVVRTTSPPKLTDFEDLFVNNSGFARIATHLNRFNPIRVMRMESMEIRHSAILAWLLSPNESHGLGDKFLRAFLGEALRGQAKLGNPTALDTFRTDLRGSQVRRERQNIDILVRVPEAGWVFVVENKFESKQRDGQLSGYIEKVRSLAEQDGEEVVVRGIFLTLHDEEPADDRYAPVNYEAICEILPDIMARDGQTLSGEVRTFLTHYIEILEERLGVSKERNDMEKLARELYRDNKKVLDFIIEHGVNSDFAIGVQSVVGDEPDFWNPVQIDGESFHFDWIGNDMASFLPASWFDGLGGDKFDWDGCDGWWLSYPLVAWLNLVSDSDGTSGQLRLYAEVGPIAQHEFRKTLIEKIQAAASKSGTDRIRFQRGAADEGKRFSKFFKQNSISIKDVQDAEEIAAAVKKLLGRFKAEFDMVGKLLTKFQKYGKAVS